MLIDKRSILKEAKAREAARSIIAAEEKKRAAAAMKNRHSVGAKKADNIHDENRGEEFMAKKTAKETVESVKKTAEAVVAAAEEKAEETIKEVASKAKKTKKEAEVKADEVKTAVKKARTVKKAEPKVAVTVEFAGRQFLAKDIRDAVLKAYKKANKGVEIKTVEIYIKPEESAAYYVVNGDAQPEYKIEL